MLGYLENILVSDLEIELLNQFITKIITNTLVYLSSKLKGG